MNVGQSGIKWATCRETGKLEFVPSSGPQEKQYEHLTIPSQPWQRWCRRSINDLPRGTRGGAAVDTPILDSLHLLPRASIVKISTGIYGPIPKNSVVLLIGRSRLTSQGIQVHLGVTDSDYESKTHIMMSTNEPVLLEAGQRIAHLLLLSYIPKTRWIRQYW